MANIKAAQTGNWSATSTWTGGVVPVSGDNVSSNNFTVTIDVNATVANVTNGTAYTATAGGGFILNNGITLTSTLIQATGTLISLLGTNSASIVGNISSSGTTTQHQSCVVVNTSGTLSVNGNVTGNNFTQASGWGNHGITVTAGTLIVSGNVIGPAGGNGAAAPSYAIYSTTPSAITITNGNVSSSASGAAGSGIGIYLTGAANLNVTGNVSGSNVNAGSYGIYSGSASATISVRGDITAANGIPAILCQGNGNTTFSGNLIFSQNGTVPISCSQYRISPAPTASKTRYAASGSGTYVDMFTADNTSGISGVATTDVRSGVSYGGGLVGTCAVPPASAVAAGTAVGSSIGTATLTADNVRAALGLASANLDTQLAVLSNLDTTVSSRLAPSGTLATVTTLTNAPTVPTAAAIASQVRTELATELARVDVATSTRLATSGYTAPSNSDVAAIKVKTDALNTDRLAQASTVATTGAQIAAALS